MESEWENWLTMQDEDAITIEAVSAEADSVTFRVEGGALLQLLKPGADGNDLWNIRVVGDESVIEKEDEWLEAINEEYFAMDLSTPLSEVFDVIVEKRTEMFAVDSDEADAWEQAEDDYNAAEQELDEADNAVLALGLMHNYSKLSPSVQRQYAQFGFHIEAQQLILNKDNYCVSRVEMNESYPFLLVCIDLSQIDIRRDFAEFIDLDRDKEIYLELSIAQQRLINLEDDQLPL